MSLSVNELKKLNECESAIFAALGDDLHLVPILTKRIIATFSLKVDQVFPNLGFLEAVSAPVGHKVNEKTPGSPASDTSSKIEEKETPKGVAAQKAAPVEKKESDFERSAREFDSLIKNFNDLPGLLEARKKALPESKGSQKTRMTKLKTVSSDLDATITVILKSRSSADISSHQLATFNNSLIAFAYQCVKVLTIDCQPLPSAAQRLIKQLSASGSKLCKVWHLARNLPSSNWKYNGNLGNVTEVLEHDDAQSDGGNSEW
jgi:hypothetical protein